MSPASEDADGPPLVTAATGGSEDSNDNRVYDAMEEPMEGTDDKGQDAGDASTSSTGMSSPVSGRPP